MKKLLSLSFAILLFLICQTVSAQTPAANGIKLTDPERGVEFTAPNGSWNINTSKSFISLNHETFYDAHVTLKKSWYMVGTAQEAYNKRKDSLKSYLPGAIFVKENEPVTLTNGVGGISMTYKNPSDLKIQREIIFIYKNQPYELVFQAKEENFQEVKADFGFILQNMRLF